MKIKIKDSYKIITVITLSVAILFITASIAKNIGQTLRTSNFQTDVKSLHIDICILVMGNKVEALKELIAG